MPAFDSTTPRIARKFLGTDFTVPAPFTAGHALTAAEATWLNGALASVIGNAYSGDIRRAREAGHEATPNQADFDAKYAEYAMGVSTRGSGTAGKSPVAQLVHTLATQELKRRIAGKGLKVVDFQRAKVTVDGAEMSKFTQLLGQLIEREGDTFTAQAEALLEQAEANADASDDLDFSLDGAGAETEAGTGDPVEEEPAA